MINDTYYVVEWTEDSNATPWAVKKGTLASSPSRSMGGSTAPRLYNSYKKAMRRVSNPDKQRVVPVKLVEQTI